MFAVQARVGWWQRRRREHHVATQDPSSGLWCGRKKNPTHQLGIGGAVIVAPRSKAPGCRHSQRLHVCCPGASGVAAAATARASCCNIRPGTSILDLWCSRERKKPSHRLGIGSAPVTTPRSKDGMSAALACLLSRCEWGGSGASGVAAVRVGWRRCEWGGGGGDGGSTML
jgi:hypothetical protein